MDKELQKEIEELIKGLQFQDKGLQFQDSVEIGNSKTGVVKVYCNFSNKEEAEAKLKNAIAVLKGNRAEVLE